MSTTANNSLPSIASLTGRQRVVLDAMIEAFLTTTPGGRIIDLAMGRHAATGIRTLIANGQARIVEQPGPTPADRSYVLELTPLGLMLAQIPGV